MRHRGRSHTGNAGAISGHGDAEPEGQRRYAAFTGIPAGSIHDLRQHGISGCGDGDRDCPWKKCVGGAGDNFPGQLMRQVCVNLPASSRRSVCTG